MRIMDIAEVEEHLSVIGDAKLHGEMCKTLFAIYSKVLGIFPTIEAARPRSTTGIQALCSLHVALEKTKNILQHCAGCSKLYLAITGDSVVVKFEKAKFALEDSLRRVNDIVPEAIGCEISEISCELEGIEFSLDPSEKQIGEDIIALLQQGRRFSSNCNDSNELESFHQAASRLGITSSRAAIAEQRSLKKLIERARMEEDKRKESIVAYLLYLMRKYSKLFRGDFSDDNDSQGSTPCSSPTVQGSFEVNGHAFDRQLSKFNSFNFKPNFRRSGQMPIPPEELRCPISLQLMHDPVIIASGQTYERICIEKWFSDGHNTCPKTQQHLLHLSLTPNYCVKGLVASWCEQNGVNVPEGPPESLDLNYWRLVLSDSDSASSKSINSIRSCKVKGIKVVPVEESCILEEVEGNRIEDGPRQEEFEHNVFRSFDDVLMILDKEEDFGKRCKLVEQIRHLLKDDEEARVFMGANGFVEALLRFLDCAVQERHVMAQETGAMALFNLAVNNNRNKEMMLAAGVLSLLDELVSKSNSYGSATALYLNLSCLDEAKAIIGLSDAVPFLIDVLGTETHPLAKLDAIHTLYNLSTLPSNIPKLLSSGIIDRLTNSLVTDSNDHAWAEKSITILINLTSSKLARDEMVLNSGLISGLATVLDMGEPVEQEQAATCLLILCNENEKCSQMVLQEGVIPSLVSISVSGTMRGKQKAQKLLMLFREQRQRDPSPVRIPQLIESRHMDVRDPEPEPQLKVKPKLLSKSVSRRKMGRSWSFWWKNKSFSQC